MNLLQPETSASIFIITGMHRSGTSLVTHMLQSAGLHIGRELLEGNAGNAKGYFENVEFYGFHQDILKSQEISEDGWTLQEKITVEEQYFDRAQALIAQHSMAIPWGWKDPRTTLFLDFWANLLPTANFLLIYRAPWEVVDSLYRRADAVFQREPELAPKIWLNYNQKIIDFYNQYPTQCLLTNINTIIKSPEKYLLAISQKFGIQWSNSAKDIYDSSLFTTNYQDSHRSSLINSYFPEAIEMFEELEARSWQPEQVLDLSWHEGLRSSPYKTWIFQDWMNFKQLESSYNTLRSERQEIESKIDQDETQLQNLETQLQQSQTEVGQTQYRLEQFQAEIERLQNQLQQNHNELLEIQRQLEQSQAEQENLKAQANQAQAEARQRQLQLHQVQEELEESEISRHQSATTIEDLQRILRQNRVSWSSYSIRNPLKVNWTELSSYCYYKHGTPIEIIIISKCHNVCSNP